MADDLAEAAKAAGNACVQQGDFVGALRHYTEAIAHTQGKDHALWSNRAFAFTKLEQHARALADATVATKLAPNWPKGHFRRAEALKGAGLHAKAHNSYRLASALDPSDQKLLGCCAESGRRAIAERQQNGRFAAVGSLIGLVLALLLLGADASARGALPAVSRSGLTIGALIFLGIVGGGITSVHLQSVRESRVAEPTVDNEQFVRMQFPGMKISADAARKVATAAGVAGGQERDAAGASDPAHPPGGGAERARARPRVRSTNKSFRNRQ